MKPAPHTRTVDFFHRCRSDILLLHLFFFKVRAAFKHKTKVWTLTSSSIRNINVKPFHSDVVRADSLSVAGDTDSSSFLLLPVFQMNGNKEGGTPTKVNTWDKSTNSANRISLSAV